MIENMDELVALINSTFHKRIDENFGEFEDEAMDGPPKYIGPATETKVAPLELFLDEEYAIKSAAEIYGLILAHDYTEFVRDWTERASAENKTLHWKRGGAEVRISGSDQQLIWVSWDEFELK